MGKEKKRAEKERLREKEAEREKKTGAAWTEAQLALLVNAVGRYPGGTMQRWVKIQKVVGRERSTDEIIAKVKELTKRSKHKNKQKEKKRKKEKESSPADESSAEASWTKEEQTALEKALRAVQKLDKSEKWDKVEEMVPGKTKKQCKERFKWIRKQLKAQQKPKK